MIRLNDNGLLYLRALVLHPQVHADERLRADDVGARIVAGAVPLEIARHSGLAPLSAVQGRWEGEVFAL